MHFQQKEHYAVEPAIDSTVRRARQYFAKLPRELRDVDEARKGVRLELF